MYGFKVLRVHEKSGELVFVHLQSEQNSETYVVNTALHCSVHCFRMIGIIMLWTCRMQFLIIFFMVGFLKQNVSSNACIS